VFRPGEKIFLPKRGYGHPGKNDPGAAVLSGPNSLKQEDFCSS